MGEFAVLRRRGDGEAVECDGAAFLGDDELDGGFLHGDLNHVTAIVVDEIEFASGEGAFGVIDFEFGDVLLPFVDEFNGGVDLGLVSGIDVIAERQEGGTDGFALVVEEAATLCDFGLFEHVPRRLEVFHFFRIIANARETDEIGDRVGHVFVDDQVFIRLVEILLDVGQQRHIDVAQHALFVHGFGHIGGGDDAVIAARTSLQLGVHGFVGIEDIDFDFAVEFFFELFDDAVSEIIAPIVDVKRLFRLAARDEADDSDQGECARDKGVLHLCSSVFMVSSFWAENTIINVSIKKTTESALRTAVFLPWRMALWI